MQNRDELYRNLLTEDVSPFEFDTNVAQVFGDMVRRSVPGYTWTLQMMELIAELFAKPGGRIYDLGCSLGEGMYWLAKGSSTAKCEIIGIDSSSAMLEKAQNMCTQAQETQAHRLKFVHADLLDVEFQQADLIALNFTLQFIPPEKREGLLARCFKALKPEGGLILSEKVCHENPEQEQLLTHLHERFKSKKGYSSMEIARKRTALEDVLISESEDAHKKRLQNIGFKTVFPWMRCFHFVSLLGIKA